MYVSIKLQLYTSMYMYYIYCLVLSRWFILLTNTFIFWLCSVRWCCESYVTWQALCMYVLCPVLTTGTRWTWISHVLCTTWTYIWWCDKTL